eukprot:4279195-Ditylum_brightwellii.AAC.1
MQELETESMRQQEMIYNAEFQIQQMEQKVSRGLGERSDEEKHELQGRIKKLESELDSQKEKQKGLSQQCKMLESELRIWKSKKDRCGSRKSETQKLISEVELEISSCEVSLKKLVSKKEETMVSHDVIRLELRRLRDTLRSRADEVCSLEVRQEQLILSMAERKEEVK